MNKILGIFGLLIFVCVFTTVLSDDFDTPLNLYNVTRWSALFAIISIGVAFVIITGGIDLSIGSLLSLLGCVLAVAVMDWGWSVYASMAFVMLISLGLGLLHGLLITKLKLQPFVVTLCGLLFYRGLARWFAKDQPQGFGQSHNAGIRQLAIGKPWADHEFNMATLLLYAGVILAATLCARSIWLWFRKDHDRFIGSLLGLGFAVLLVVIGLSQHLTGEGANFVLGIAGIKLAVTPANLMFLCGLLIFVPASVSFIWCGMRDHTGKVLLPLACLLVSAGLFAVVARSLALEFARISPGDQSPYQFGLLTMTGARLRTLIMTVVFLVTGGLMGAIGWLTTTTANISPAARRLLPTVVFSGVLWLMGMTRLPETMVPMPLLILIGCAIVASIFLNQTIYGRYLLALGRNEQAAKYSGINTDRMIILAYVICAGMGGLGAILFAADINNLQPANHGNIYELYAIAAAVLGGCSLRGGEGTIIGVIIGAAVMRVLYNAINVLGIDTKLEWAIIGIVILTGVIADEVVKRFVAQRRAKLQAEQLDAAAS
jgi:ribose/xylose/arabinose/galactoside ABC-type transport system permease subunit